MLPATQWRAEAIMRLVLSVFICVYAGSILAVLAGYFLHSSQAKSPAPIALAVAALLCLSVAFIQARKPWNLETIRRQLGWIMGLFYGGIVLGLFAQKLIGASKPAALHILISGIAFQGAVLVLAHLTLSEHGLTWSEAFGFRHNPWRAVGLGLAVGCLFLPAGWLLQQVSAWLLQHGGPAFKPEEQEAVRILKNTARYFDRASLGVVTVILAPVAEETLFRGILFTWIRQLGYQRAALWTTSVLFAAIHLNAVIFLPLLALSLALALLYERTGNLLAPIATHALFNALNFLMLQLVSPPSG